MRCKLTLFFAVVFALMAFPTLQAQQLELGIKGGFSVYSGDLSPREIGIYLEDWNPAGGAYLRYRPTPRFGIRVNGNFGRISAEQDGQILIDDMGTIAAITRNFRSSMTEFNAVLEYDLFYIGDRESNFFAPYVYGGLGVLSFNPEGNLGDGVFRELQPLATEGQGTGNPDYDVTRYNLTRVALVLGAGMRVRFSDRFVIGLELGGRKPGTDYLDDISDTRVRYLDILAIENGGESARFSNPGVTNPAEASDFSYVRGGDAEDYYFFGSLTVGVTIGAGGSKKTGCYQF